MGGGGHTFTSIRLYPSPYLHAIVGFLSLAIACIMFPSSHTAPLTYPLRDSATSTFLSSCFRTTLCLSSSSPLSPLSAPSESSLRSDLPPSKLLLSRTSNLQRLSIQTAFNLHFWDISFLRFCRSIGPRPRVECSCRLRALLYYARDDDGRYIADPIGTG